ALALVIAGLTVWTYAGMERVTFSRLLAVLGLRLGALLLALMLVLRPYAVDPNEDQPPPSTLLILLDNSRSMNIRDEAGLNERGDKNSRWDVGLGMLRSERCVELLKKLKVERNIQVAYYLAAEDITPFDPKDNPGKPDGRRTDMGQWLHSGYQRHARDPNLRAFVLIADGTDPATADQAVDLAEQWSRIPCPIHAFPLGKKKEIIPQERDLAFLPDSMTTDPAPVAVKNKLTVRARLQVTGY